MWLNPWNKLLAASVSLAAGGILACIGAIMEATMPNAPVIVSISKLILTVLAIGGVMTVAMWIYGRADDYWIDRLDRRLGVKKETRDTRPKRPERPGKTPKQPASRATHLPRSLPAWLTLPVRLHIN